MGGIRIDYGSVRKRDAREIRRRTAMVFQSYNLFTHMTALENVTEGPRVVKRVRKEDAISTAMRFLAKVGLADKAGFYPAQLSGGQQQRVAIARALAMNPDIILFDEPTSALDPELVKEVLSVMKDIAREGQTMIVVTHEMGFAREVATDVAFMDSGLILETGRSGDFFRNPSTARAQQFLSQIIPDYTYAI
jgi:L-cystine transport system ATP-binding protein